MQRNRLYIAGAPGGSSIAPPVHEFIARSFGLDWTCEFLYLESAKEVEEVYRDDNFSGGIVTMPHKREIIPLLDEVDESVRQLVACNLVYPGPNGFLHGTNTDWIGIRDAIRAVAGRPLSTSCALVYGAGGAARAAVFALVKGFGCQTIYVVNRDVEEVEDLVKDVSTYHTPKRGPVLHVKGVEQAKLLEPPSLIVCTVPDFDPVTKHEKEARETLKAFLEAGSYGILVDMCYHPLETYNIKLASQRGWTTVDGVTIIAHQLQTQWRYFFPGQIPAAATKMLRIVAIERSGGAAHA
jgi:quinate dehydrogenase